MAPLISDKTKATWYLRGFGLAKVPMILFCNPSVVELSDRRCEIRVPLNWRTRNHLGSMYFGALCVGADVAGGLIAMRLIERAKASVSLVFKDVRAEFLKRPEGDVHFSCEDGDAIAELVRKTVSSSERQNQTVRITATVPKISGAEPVARFELTLSLKKRQS